MVSVRVSVRPAVLGDAAFQERGMLALTRQVTFNAGHVYRGGGLSRRELEALFGRAALPAGHGHDYVLEVTVEGEVSGRDGMVVNIKDLDRELKQVVTPLDHRLLNETLAEFHDAVPTTERLAQILWHRIGPLRIGTAAASRLRLQEHPGLSVEVEGKEPRMVYLTRSIEFAASHRLHSDQLTPEQNRSVYGKCNNPHGHNYVAEVTVKGEPDPRTGIVIELDKLDRLMLEEIEERFDHKHLDLDTPYFRGQVATAENIARVLWELLAPKIPACRSGGRVVLHRVRLIETARSWFDYFGP